MRGSLPMTTMTANFLAALSLEPFGILFRILEEATGLRVTVLGEGC